MERANASPMPADTARKSSENIVYIVDDDETLRRSLGSLFRSLGLRVESFASTREFLLFDRPPLPSCLVLDVRLQGESGLAFQAEAARAGLRLPILFMTGHGDVQMSVNAMKRGAVDFLTKPFREQDMVDAVTEALKADANRIEAERAVSGLRAAYELLTPREREVMRFVVTGMMNKQIAANMDIHEITVKVHRGQVMRKMQARTVPDLVRMAEALGIEPHRA
ncbi:response regulator transcription factor [Trinickia diaoshuihuensis]|uniref:response regulator transcription factor n=1 Tax=Trinickia diaoshuihuensis TaxID=2292265 RepID=UPI001F0782D4|nr:response regulator [Trinickia diaoshuihuensis]